MNIYDATTSDVSLIRRLAEEIWPVTYGHLMSVEQLSYMLKRIYGEEALHEAMTSAGQEFILISDDKGVQGFAAFGIRPEDRQVYKLHKLYVSPGTQGKGYGKALLNHIIARLKARNIDFLDLNVKRDNPAAAFYAKMGFEIIRNEDIPFGEFTLTDFVMRRSLS